MGEVGQGVVGQGGGRVASRWTKYIKLELVRLNSPVEHRSPVHHFYKRPRISIRPSVRP